MHTKRFCSHILPLLMIPFVIVFMAVWYQIVLWILSLLERVPFLMKLLNCMDGILQDAAGLGILGLLATVIINWIVQALIDCSQKLCPSAKGTRFMVTAILGFVVLAALLVSYYLNQNAIQDRCHLGWIQMLFVLYGLGVISYSLLKSSISTRKSASRIRSRIVPAAPAKVSAPPPSMNPNNSAARSTHRLSPEEREKLVRERERLLAEQARLEKKMELLRKASRQDTERSS